MRTAPSGLVSGPSARVESRWSRRRISAATTPTSTGRPVVFNLSQTDFASDMWKQGLEGVVSAGERGVPLYAQSAGRAIGILRYGRSFEKAALYEQQFGAHFLLYEPRIMTGLKNDLVGIAFTWADTPVDAARSEYTVELFYRFPLFPNVDTTFAYQSVFNPALSRDLSHASAFSLRIRAAF